MVADELAEQSWSQVEPQMTRGIYGIEGVRDKIGSTMPVFWVHGNQLEYLKTTKDILSAEVVSETYKYPSVNVVGTIAGTDAKLKMSTFFSADTKIMMECVKNMGKILFITEQMIMQVLVLRCWRLLELIKTARKKNSFVCISRF